MFVLHLFMLFGVLTNLVWGLALEGKSAADEHFKPDISTRSKRQYYDYLNYLIEKHAHCADEHLAPLAPQGAFQPYNLFVFPQGLSQSGGLVSNLDHNPVFPGVGMFPGFYNPPPTQVYSSYSAGTYVKSPTLCDQHGYRGRTKPRIRYKGQQKNGGIKGFKKKTGRKSEKSSEGKADDQSLPKELSKTNSTHVILVNLSGNNCTCMNLSRKSADDLTVRVGCSTTEASVKSSQQNPSSSSEPKEATDVTIPPLPASGESLVVSLRPYSATSTKTKVGLQGTGGSVVGPPTISATKTQTLGFESADDTAHTIRLPSSFIASSRTKAEELVNSTRLTFVVSSTNAEHETGKSLDGSFSAATLGSEKRTGESLVPSLDSTIETNENFAVAGVTSGQSLVHSTISSSNESLSVSSKGTKTKSNVTVTGLSPEESLVHSTASSRNESVGVSSISSKGTKAKSNIAVAGESSGQSLVHSMASSSNESLGFSLKGTQSNMAVTGVSSGKSLVHPTDSSSSESLSVSSVPSKGTKVDFLTLGVILSSPSSAINETGEPLQATLLSASATLINNTSQVGSVRKEADLLPSSRSQTVTRVGFARTGEGLDEPRLTSSVSSGSRTLVEPSLATTSGSLTSLKERTDGYLNSTSLRNENQNPPVSSSSHSFTITHNETATTGGISNPLLLAQMLSTLQGDQEEKLLETQVLSEAVNPEKLELSEPNDLIATSKDDDKETFWKIVAAKDHTQSPSTTTDHDSIRVIQNNTYSFVAISGSPGIDLNDTDSNDFEALRGVSKPQFITKEGDNNSKNGQEVVSLAQDNTSEDIIRIPFKGSNGKFESSMQLRPSGGVRFFSFSNILGSNNNQQEDSIQFGSSSNNKEKAKTVTFQSRDSLKEEFTSGQDSVATLSLDPGNHQLGRVRLISDFDNENPHDAVGSVRDISEIANEDPDEGPSNLETGKSEVRPNDMTGTGSRTITFFKKPIGNAKQISSPQIFSEPIVSEIYPATTMKSKLRSPLSIYWHRIEPKSQTSIKTLKELRPFMSVDFDDVNEDFVAGVSKECIDYGYSDEDCKKSKSKTRFPELFSFRTHFT